MSDWVWWDNFKPTDPPKSATGKSGLDLSVPPDTNIDGGAAGEIPMGPKKVFKRGYPTVNIVECKKVVPFALRRPFILAVLKSFQKVDIEVMNKVLQSIISIPECANDRSYLNSFENIYNRKVRNIDKKLKL